MRVEIQYDCITVCSVEISMRDIHTCMTLDGGNGSVQQLCILFMSVTLCVLKCQLLTIISWYLETCRYFTAWKLLSELHLVFTTRVLWCFHNCVNVDKLVKLYQCFA